MPQTVQATLDRAQFIVRELNKALTLLSEQPEAAHTARIAAEYDQRMRDVAAAILPHLNAALGIAEPETGPEPCPWCGSTLRQPPTSTTPAGRVH